MENFFEKCLNQEITGRHGAFIDQITVKTEDVAEVQTSPSFGGDGGKLIRGQFLPENTSPRLSTDRGHGWTE